jgi:hypothetical protein
MACFLRIGYPFTVGYDHLDLIALSGVHNYLAGEADEGWTGLHFSPKICPPLGCSGGDRAGSLRNSTCMYTLHITGTSIAEFPQEEVPCVSFKAK